MKLRGAREEKWSYASFPQHWAACAPVPALHRCTRSRGLLGRILRREITSWSLAWVDIWNQLPDSTKCETQLVPTWPAKEDTPMKLAMGLSRVAQCIRDRKSEFYDQARAQIPAPQATIP